MPTKIDALELALSKVIEPNSPIIRNRREFDALVEPYLRRKSVIQAMKEYLKSSHPAPRILALLVYSSRGNALIREWMSQGMNARLLYKAMLNEGTFWRKAGADFPLHDDVVHGEECWDFDAKEYFQGVELISALPGAVEAMVERFRSQGRIQEVLKYLSVSVLRRLIREHSLVFAPEVLALPYELDAKEDGWEDTVAMDILREHLDPTHVVYKILRQRIP